MKIGYLVQQYLPEVGAGPARVAEMARRWTAAGAQVTVITGMPNRPQGVIHPDYRGRWFVDEEMDGIRVLRSWLYASPRHGFARTLVNNGTFMLSSALHMLARAGGLDVLIASSPPFFPHLAGRGVALLRGVPLVLEVRDLWPDYLVGMGVLKPGSAASRAVFRVERGLLRAAERVVVVTDSFRERIVGKGVAPERVDVISNGVDTAFYRPADEPAPLPSLERGDGAFVVGYLGNMGAGQGLSAVVDAAALLARRAPEVRVVIAGDGPERERVGARIAELGLGNVALHPPIAKDRTRAFYNACDVCLVPLAPFPILAETVPSKIFEVMACARPVLASLAGEGARIVRESGGGLVAPAGDAEAIARGVLELRDLGPARREAMGRAGREYVAQHYNRDALAARYLAVLREAAARAVGRPAPEPTPA